MTEPGSEAEGVSMTVEPFDSAKHKETTTEASPEWCPEEAEQK
jgi:hypothetical protein